MFAAGSDLKGLSTYSFDYRNLRASAEWRAKTARCLKAANRGQSDVEKFFFSPVFFELPRSEPKKRHESPCSALQPGQVGCPERTNGKNK
jgi:hypothetical protein